MKNLRLIACSLVFAAGMARAQDLYVYSDIQVNDSTGDGTATFSSSTDYYTEYYYDLFTEGWLYFQPDGGSQSLVCNNYGSVANQSYVSSSCTANVGSAAGYFYLSTVHDLWTVYYVYQINSGCYYDCYDYEDMYGYSLVSNPSYNDNTYVYAPGYAVAIPQYSAITAQLGRQARKGSCIYPSSETTYNYGYTNSYYPFLGLFLQDLNGGSFNGRYVTEVFSGNASDQCWRSGNSYSPVTSLSDHGTWYVSSIVEIDSSGYATYQYTRSNSYGYDNLGFWGPQGSQILGEYVNNMRPSGSACTISAVQSMYMYCSGLTGPGQYFVTNQTIGDQIYANYSSAQLTTYRGSSSNVRSYP